MNITEQLTRDTGKSQSQSLVNPLPDQLTVRTSLDRLAIFGGKPAFGDPLYVGRPNIGPHDRILERIKDILESGRLTNRGPQVIQFEQRLSELTGVKHCIALCNATIALEIAIRALEMTGEVIVPSFTFVATAHALQWQEISPVFCDIDPATHTIDPAKVECLITPRTSAIIGVHLWGAGCAVEQLTEIAQRRKLRLLFDAAHACGCSHQGRMIGGFGDAEVLSFHATKFVNAFEGGAILTNNDELANKIRLMTNFGFQGFDHVIYLGTNGKMSEVCAAMGLTSLDSMEEFIAINRRNYLRYRQELCGLKGVRLLPYDPREKRNFQYIVLEIDSDAAGLHRDVILQVLHAENVVARRYFYPGVHRMEPYRSFQPHAGFLLPATNALVQRILVLSTGTAIGEKEIIEICGIIRFCLENATELKARLETIGVPELPDLR
jgi:dTDP-4-amino-4,6-dideoxygalactose transaminase